MGTLRALTGSKIALWRDSVELRALVLAGLSDGSKARIHLLQEPQRQLLEERNCVATVGDQEPKRQNAHRTAEDEHLSVKRALQKTRILTDEEFCTNTRKGHHLGVTSG